jgi:hypothetical protein
MDAGFWLKNVKKRRRFGPRRGRTDYIIVDLRDMGEDVEWIHLAQDKDK